MHRPRIATTLSSVCALFALSRTHRAHAQNGQTGIVLENMDTMSVNSHPSALSAVSMLTLCLGLFCNPLRFSFGDSYTTTGYKPYEGGVTQLEGIGKTTSGGYNWVQFLAYSQPKLATSYYDLAYSGATTNNSVVASNVPCFIDQANIWRDWFAKPDSEVKWRSNSTLFTVWFGINDVGFATVSNQNSTEQRPLIFATYWNVIDMLYAHGARNILLLGVPPTNRSPFVQSTNEVIVSIFEDYIAGYNAHLYEFAQSLSQKYKDMNVALFDTQGLFNAILDQPELYGFKDSTSFCNQYSWSTNKPNDSQEICRYPLAQYVWYNSYHPSWTVHRLLASMLAAPVAESSFEEITTTLFVPTASASLGSGTDATATSDATTTKLRPRRPLLSALAVAVLTAGSFLVSNPLV
ncbi:hypothetical protein JCM3766R1_001639 [Sporobolomyces carnicolor]